MKAKDGMANVGLFSDFWDQSSHELCGGCMVRRLHLLRFWWRKCVSNSPSTTTQFDMPATVLHPHTSLFLQCDHETRLLKPYRPPTPGLQLPDAFHLWPLPGPDQDKRDR